MSRLIDAERLKRTFRASVPPVAQDFVEGFCAIVDNVSNVDAVEVVRCGECKHYWRENEEYVLCNYSGHGYTLARTKDWFCADGERKEDEREPLEMV